MFIKWGLLLLVLMGMVGCSTSSRSLGGAVYSRSEARKPLAVTFAKVAHIRSVLIAGESDGIGAAAGGIVGGALGNDYAQSQVQPTNFQSVSTFDDVYAAYIQGAVPSVPMFDLLTRLDQMRAANFNSFSAYGFANGVQSSDTKQLLGTVLGALGGAAVGHVVQDYIDQKEGIEIAVRLENSKKMLVVVQEDEGADFREGDRVMVLTSQDGNYRVVPWSQP